MLSFPDATQNERIQGKGPFLCIHRTTNNDGGRKEFPEVTWSPPTQAGAPRAGCPGLYLGFVALKERHCTTTLGNLCQSSVTCMVRSVSWCPWNCPAFQLVPITSAPVRTEERRRSEKKKVWRLERPCWAASWLLLQSQYSGFMLLDFSLWQSPCLRG